MRKKKRVGKGMERLEGKKEIDRGKENRKWEDLRSKCRGVKRREGEERVKTERDKRRQRERERERHSENRERERKSN